MESFMHLLCQLWQPTVMNDVPELFGTLDEYEHHWHYLRRAQSAIGPLMHELVLSSGVIGCSDAAAINTSIHHILGHPQVLAFYADNRQKMQTLEKAFLPLFHRIMLQSHDSKDYLRALHLRLQYLGPAYGTSLQCGLSMWLFGTALFCRDAVVRDEAVVMLGEYPGQDGLWSTRALHVLAVRNRDVEKANAVEGSDAEQWARLWRREYALEEGGAEVIFRYMERDEHTAGWAMVEEGAVVPAVGEATWVKRRPRSEKLLMEDLMLST
ncbi:hypothetical protein HYQ46_006074 [Verticillium longisporum]|nr:hypothetical protein HYQ46_006074 [Verticillium longisporum]